MGPDLLLGREPLPPDGQARPQLAGGAAGELQPARGPHTVHRAGLHGSQIQLQREFAPILGHGVSVVCVCEIIFGVWG